jgi:hypothetical protein
MEYPKRPEQHVIEDKSFRIFTNKVPPEWIVRETTKRDYGIDCYMEIIAEGNFVTGNMVLIQLKGTKKIDWHNNNGEMLGDLSGVPKSTVNYWRDLPVPVFICIVELETERVYFVNIKKAIRENFERFAKNKTFSFLVNQKGEITKENAGILFFITYLLERNYENYENHLITFLMHLRECIAFFGENIGRDEFMEVEDEAHLFIVHLYNTLWEINNQLLMDWKIPSLDEWYKKDRETFNHNFQHTLHELTITAMLKSLCPKLIQILEKVKERILNKEKGYLIYTNLSLFSFCMKISLEDIKSEFSYILKDSSNQS